MPTPIGVGTSSVNSNAATHGFTPVLVLIAPIIRTTAHAAGDRRGRSPFSFIGVFRVCAGTDRGRSAAARPDWPPPAPAVANRRRRHHLHRPVRPGRTHVASGGTRRPALGACNGAANG